MTDYRELIRAAFAAREKAYTPYSGFQVGAALLAKDGTVYGGCNIENASYGATNCAERTAFFRAVFDGKRDFSAIAVVGGKTGGEYVEAWPCGICRQVMMEFCDPEAFRVILYNGKETETYTLAELLPLGFGPSKLD